MSNQEAKSATTIETTTCPAGNTKAAGRHFQIVVNDKVLAQYESIKAYLSHWKGLNYYLCTEHVGSPNKHYHIYVQYQYPVKMNYSKLLGAHVDKCYGSPQQNYRYLMCQDEKHPEEGVHAEIIDEWGTLRNAGGRTIKDVLEMSKEERNDLPIQYYNIVKNINTSQENDIKVDDWHKDIEVVWITGHSGAGKSQLAKAILKNKKIETFNELKFDGNFWLGCGSNSTAAVYDDFRDSHMRASEFINFIDYNKHNMNIKGGVKRNDYSLIIITSIQDPDMIYSNMPAEAKQQWLRRIKVIDLDAMGDNH